MIPVVFWWFYRFCYFLEAKKVATCPKFRDFWRFADAKHTPNWRLIDAPLTLKWENIRRTVGTDSLWPGVVPGRLSMIAFACSSTFWLILRYISSHSSPLPPLHLHPSDRCKSGVYINRKNEDAVVVRGLLEPKYCKISQNLFTQA